MEGQISDISKNDDKEKEEEDENEEEDDEKLIVLDPEDAVPMRSKFVKVTTYSELYPQEKRFIIRLVNAFNFYSTSHGRKTDQQQKCLDMILNEAKLTMTIKMLKTRLQAMIDEYRSGKHQDTYKDVKDEIERIEASIHAENAKKKVVKEPSISSKEKKRTRKEEDHPIVSDAKRIMASAPVLAIESESQQIASSIIHNLSSISREVQNLEILLATARQVEESYSNLNKSLFKNCQAK